MISLNGIEIKPTIFPDGTSQVWKLNPALLEQTRYVVDWRFESEREIIDLLSLRELFYEVHGGWWDWDLFVPYLPYARQDKDVSNESTFNLHVFAELIDWLQFNRIISVDVHNDKVCKNLIADFYNQSVDAFHLDAIEKCEATCLVFPDKGAKDRYDILRYKGLDSITFKKVRDPLTGFISGHELDQGESSIAPNVKSFLMLDDLVDGGATFVSVAKFLKKLNPDAKIALFATHGIFSKGLEPLHEAGIKQIFTTNSLPRNNNFPGVYKV